MFGFFKRETTKDSGMTLAEVVVAMALSAIVFTGMLVAYTQGIRHTREDSDTMMMYSEGMAAMSKMGRYIREAGRIRITSYGGVANARMELDYPGPGFGGGEVEFIFSEATNKLRWNNRRENVNRLNMILLPILDIETGPQDVPYLRVKDCSFTPLDHIGAPSPTLEGWGLVKIEMVLEDVRGDTLYMSSIHAKKNRLQ